jgi:hypothetical protein
MSPGLSSASTSSNAGGISPICTITGSPAIHAPAADDDAAGTHLHAADHVAVGRDHRQCAVDIDETLVDQFGNAVAGHQPDRADIDKGAYRFALAVQHVFAQAMETRLARRAGIGHRRDAAGKPALVRAHRNIGAAVPDMHVQVRPARRQKSAVAVNDLGARLGRRQQRAVGTHGQARANRALEPHGAEIRQRESRHRQSSPF